MKPNRRGFLSIIGMTPIAAKSAVDAELAKQAGLHAANGLGNIGGYGMPSGASQTAAGIPYEQRISGAVNYIKTFGLPEFMEREIRERSRYVTALDPDIASKKSWSMSVKIMTQRQRQYERDLRNSTSQDWHTERSAIKKILGFDWPW